MRISDWSSDVCSSDLAHPPVRLVELVRRLRQRTAFVIERIANARALERRAQCKLVGARTRQRIDIQDRKSVGEGKRVSGRVDLGGGRVIKTTKHNRKVSHRLAECKEKSMKIYL